MPKWEVKMGKSKVINIKIEATVTIKREGYADLSFHDAKKLALETVGPNWYHVDSVRKNYNIITVTLERF